MTAVIDGHSPPLQHLVMAAHLWLGDEAVAWAAIDAGIGGAFSYAGTPATEIFAILSDASRHADFDGSGSVRQARKAPERLHLGSKFSMEALMERYKG